MEDALLGSVPEWFAVRFLSSAAYDSWNEIRFEREFMRLQDRNPKIGLSIKNGTDSGWKITHRHVQPSLDYSRGGKKTGAERRIVLEPSDLVAVACGIKEATSIPLGSVPASGRRSARDGFANLLTDGHEHTELRELEDNAANHTLHLKMDPSSFDSAPQYTSSISSASTSVTEVTDPCSLNKLVPGKGSEVPAPFPPSISRNEPVKVGCSVDLNQINLSLRFEYLEDPKSFLRKHSHDDEILRTLAFQLQKRKKKHRSDEEIVEDDIGAEAHDSEDETADGAPATQDLAEDVVPGPASKHSLEAVLKFLYVGSSLFDAHDYSVVRKPNNSHRLGNNFVGYDRYRMSAALTKEERLEKLVSAVGGILEFSVRYFLEECPDPDATVPGHDDIKFTDVLNAKRQSFVTSRIRPAATTCNDSGHSIQIGFPDCTVDSYANSLYSPLIDFKDRRDGYFSNKQHAHHFGLGVFRIDPPRNVASKRSTSSQSKPSDSTCAIDDSESPSSYRNSSRPREMPGLIGDENNRHDPRHRVIVPPGLIFAPDFKKAFRTLRLERDPRHPRWRLRSAPEAPDPSALYASGPPVAVRRHSEQIAPLLRAESIYKQSWTRKRTNRGRDGPKDDLEAVDGAADEQDEEGVACGEPDPDAMVEVHKMDLDAEDTATINAKEESIVALEKSCIAPAMKRDDPLRKPRQVRRVRFQT